VLYFQAGAVKKLPFLAQEGYLFEMSVARR
jgi:hypothetical protein